MEDVQHRAMPIRTSQHMPPLYDGILHRRHTPRHCTHLCAAIPRFQQLDEHVNCTHCTTFGGICKNFNAIRTQHRTRNYRSASHTYITRMLSACLWIFTKSFKHVLTSIQYQVFQDLQGPASSLRVGSSVRTSTWPLSVSLLHLRLRYLTCIQRR